MRIKVRSSEQNIGNLRADNLAAEVALFRPNQHSQARWKGAASWSRSMRCRLSLPVAIMMLCAHLYDMDVRCVDSQAAKAGSIMMEALAGEAEKEFDDFYELQG
jgi:hypothetical protein